MRAMSCSNFYKEITELIRLYLAVHISSAGHQDLEPSASTRCEVRRSL